MHASVHRDAINSQLHSQNAATWKAFCFPREEAQYTATAREGEGAIMMGFPLFWSDNQQLWIGKRLETWE